MDLQPEPRVPVVGENPSAWTLFVRAVRLRCPVCGKGKVFPGAFNFMKMKPSCEFCGRVYEREPGFFLGSIYFNYGATVIFATVFYFIPFFWQGRPVQSLLVPIIIFCIVFPLVFFRYSRCLFMSFDHFFSTFDTGVSLPGDRREP
ncbi:MAG: hypothetical protein NVSMB14_15210 [Isosphaeraceae bacterium]